MAGFRQPMGGQLAESTRRSRDYLLHAHSLLCIRISVSEEHAEGDFDSLTGNPVSRIDRKLAVTSRKLRFVGRIGTDKRPSRQCLIS